MNIPEIFLHAVWEKMWWFCGTAIGISIAVVGRLALTRDLTFFIQTASFPELAAFTKDEQQRLLREAGRESFGALSFVPVLVYLAFFLGGLPLALTFQRVTATSYWVAVILFCPFTVLGLWLARRLEAHRVRPFLKKLIDEQNGKSVA